jgi:hypothetical protein
MTVISDSNPPTAVQDSNDARTDLARDIAALLGRTGEIDSFAIQSRPAILRRVARALGEQIPAGTDRLIARYSDAALATAVSLHTGIAFALADEAAGVCGGELHRSESVAVLQTRTPSDVTALPARISREGARVERVLTVIETASAQHGQSWYCWSLFRLADLSRGASAEHGARGDVAKGPS